MLPWPAAGQGCVPHADRLSSRDAPSDRVHEADSPCGAAKLAAMMALPATATHSGVGGAVSGGPALRLKVTTWAHASVVVKYNLEM